MSTFERFWRIAIAATVAAVVLAALPLPAMAKKPVPTGNGWSGATAISPVGNPDPTRDSQLNDVAVNASGLAVAAWDQYWYSNNGGSSIGVAVQVPGAQWGTPVTVSDKSGFALHPRVAVGADGTAAVIWTYESPVMNPPATRKIQVAVRPAGATTWAVSDFTPAMPSGGVPVPGSPAVGIDQNGNVTAAWTIWNGTHNVVQAATRAPGGVWMARATLSTPGTDGMQVSLSVNARGDAAVVYAVTPWAGYNTPNVAQFVSRSGPGGAWTTPVNVSEVIPNTAGYVSNPQVALDASGLATVVYTGYGIEGTRQLSATSWTTPGPVIQSQIFGASYLSPDLATDMNGNSYVVVSVFDPTINIDRASVWVARGTSAGAWSQPVRITDPAVPIDAYATRAAVSPDGSVAMVGWIDHYHGVVQVSRLGPTGWGSANTIGKSTVLSAFQEVLSLDFASSTVGRAVWKSNSGTQQFAASYRG